MRAPAPVETAARAASKPTVRANPADRPAMRALTSGCEPDWGLDAEITREHGNERRAKETDPVYDFGPGSIGFAAIIFGGHTVCRRGELPVDLLPGELHISFEGASHRQHPGSRPAVAERAKDRQADPRDKDDEEQHAT